MNFPTENGPLYLEIDWARTRAETVVLLHGMGSCGEDWLLQRAALRGRYHLVCIDLPGHGHSRKLKGWPSLASLAKGVRQAIEHWAPTRPVHLVGLSLGSALALQMMVDQPLLFRSAVLANSFATGWVAGSGVHHLLDRALAIAGGRMDLLGERIAAGLFPSPEQAAYRSLAAQRIGANPWGNYLKLFAAIARFDIRRRLGAIACPVLLVSGELDDTVPPGTSKGIARRIPRAEWKVLPHARHGAPVDSAHLFNPLLLEFLAENRGLVPQPGPTSAPRVPAR